MILLLLLPLGGCGGGCGSGRGRAHGENLVVLLVRHNLITERDTPAAAAAAPAPFAVFVAPSSAAAAGGFFTPVAQGHPIHPRSSGLTRRFHLSQPISGRI